MNPDDPTVRPATEDDREFSYHVKKAAEGAYIEAIWGWDEEYQRVFHAKDWDERRPDIIEYEGNQVGTVYVREEDEILYIRQFFILPEYQNRGIGTEILRRAIAQADALGLAARIAFLKGNRVKFLYEKFGFHLTEQQDNYCSMEREPLRSAKEARM